MQEALARIEALPVDGPLYSVLVYCGDSDEVVRNAARSRARTFTRRQADAEEILADPPPAAFRELPNFDLQATPLLCERAKRILASKGDIKRFDIEDAGREVAPYVETMRWLLARGCDCKREIADIERAVNRLADSPRRQKLLADMAAAKSSQ